MLWHSVQLPSVDDGRRMRQPALEQRPWLKISRGGIAGLAFLLLLTAVLPGPAHSQRGQIAPEAASGFTAKTAARAGKYMISAANPLAVEAGLDILRAGGTAADAAITVQLVLNLVEPQSSGIGGGAFVLHWDERARELRTYDGRETAPAAARPDRFLRGGRPIPFEEAVHSGLSIGVPGVVRLLETLHRRHGRLPWARLIEPAIALAEAGFRVSPRLNLLLDWYGPGAFAPEARAYFFDQVGSPRPAGYVLKNPAFAETLRAIAARGADAFYAGPIADAILAAVASAPNHAGDMTAADLAAYAVKERPSVCVTYRRRGVCGMGPPSSGALAVGQTLGLLEGFDLGRGPSAALNPQAMHLIAEAEKLAFADRDVYVGDPEFVTVPATLLDSGYLALRRRMIDANAAMPRPPPGTPPGFLRQSLGEDATVERAGTSHISIIDGEGNAVAMTTTIEGAFGSGVWAAGFLLNNQLTDFSFVPADPKGRPLANAVAGGKRPRSSMAPTLVFDEAGALEAVLGSPGGSRIILYVVKALVALIDWGLDPQSAAALINFGSRGGAFEIEYDPATTAELLVRPWLSTPSTWYALEMKAFGHKIAPDLLTSGLHIVARRQGGLEGGADPRREGIAAGD
jgi:gamma-glutamyltranspeptidase/glutathione hydrolase